MRIWAEITYRWRALTQGRRMDAELRAEFDDHLAHAVRMYEEQGLDPAEARRQALMLFGGPDRFVEEARGARGWRYLDYLVIDVRQSLRRAKATPFFSAAIIFICAVGIAAMVTVSTIVSSVLFKPLPFTDPQGIEWLRINGPGSHPPIVGEGAGLAVARALTPIADVAIFRRESTSFALSDGVRQRGTAERTTASLLPLLGSHMLRGRWFSPLDATHSSNLVVLSDRMWRQHLLARPDVVGTTVSIDGVPHTVIGVMPPGFKDPMQHDVDFWLLLGNAATAPHVQHMILVRRHPLVSKRSVLNVIGDSASLVPLRDAIISDVRPALLVLLGFVVVLLALVCVNVGSLLLGMMRTRQHEFSLRHAIGASMGRITMQIVLETLFLVAAGGALAVAISFLCVRAVRAADIWAIPRLRDVATDWQFIRIAFLTTLITSVLASLVPIFGLVKSRIGALANAGSDSRIINSNWNGVHSVILAAEVALTVILLSGAGLVAKSFLRLVNDRPGFEVPNRAFVRLDLSDSTLTPSARQQLLDSALAVSRNDPNVTQAAAVSFLPYDRATVPVTLTDSGSRASAIVAQRSVTRNYLSLMSIPVRRGRGFVANDETTEQVAVMLNEAAARALHLANPVERSVVIQDNPGEARVAMVARVVGTYADTRSDGTTVRRRPEMLILYSKSPERWATVLMALRRSSPTDLAHLDHSLQSALPHVVGGNAALMSALIRESSQEPRVYASIMSGFAAIAVALSASGIFSVLIFSVSRRAREIAIRRAIGMEPINLIKTVVGDATRAVAIGCVAGFVSSLFLNGGMRAILFGQDPRDPRVYMLTLTGIGVMTLAACAIPVFRALRLDPGRILRED